MRTQSIRGGGLSLILAVAWTHGDTGVGSEVVYEACVRHDVTLVATRGTERDEHDQTVATELGQQISRLRRGREEHERGRISTYAVPGHPGHILVTEIGSSRSSLDAAIGW